MLLPEVELFPPADVKESSDETGVAWSGRPFDWLMDVSVGEEDSISIE
jgi:hypothetical protein